MSDQVRNFFIMPNFILDLEISPSAYTFYSHLRRRYGEGKTIRLTTKELSEITGLSGGTVTKVKAELLKLQLITVEEVLLSSGWNGHELVLCNVWERNAEAHKAKSKGEMIHGCYYELPGIPNPSIVQFFNESKPETVTAFLSWAEKARNMTWVKAYNIFKKRGSSWVS